MLLQLFYFLFALAKPLGKELRFLFLCGQGHARFGERLVGCIQVPLKVPACRSALLKLIRQLIALRLGCGRLFLRTPCYFLQSRIFFGQASQLHLLMPDRRLLGGRLLLRARQLLFQARYALR